MGEREVIITEADDKRGVWADKWLGGIWGVTTSHSLLCHWLCKTQQYNRGMETQEYPEWTVEGIN